MSMLSSRVKKIEDKVNTDGNDYMDLFIAESNGDGIVKVKYLYTTKESGSRGRNNETLYKEELKDKVEVMSLEEYKRRNATGWYDNSLVINITVI